MTAMLIESVEEIATFTDTLQLIDPEPPRTLQVSAVALQELFL
jgi:hypothetical protein